MTMQNHIHLDAYGLSYDADNAPAHKWGATVRQKAPVIQAVVHRSANAYTYFSKVTDSAGDPVVHNDWSYVLRCTPSELTYLMTLLGKRCELVDHDHVADGTSHTAYIQDVALGNITNIENIGPLATKYNVTIELVDLENPA